MKVERSRSELQSERKLKYKILPLDPEPYSTDWFLANYFENWSQQDIESAIKNDFQWSIAGCGQQIIDHVADQFIEWTRKFKPEFVKPLSSWNGKKWLKKNIRQMITQL